MLQSIEEGRICVQFLDQLKRKLLYGADVNNSISRSFQPAMQDKTMTSSPATAIVIIGRNEGERLARCLRSVCDRDDLVIYVDSGSDDGSQAAARTAGAHVVDLDTSQPFTAARARNVGLDFVLSQMPPPTYIQFIDGDCELHPDWIDTARRFLQAHPKAAIACGRRRERFPEASIYNRLIDQEWNTPVGKAGACGGDALMRVSALQDVGGFNPAMIAGEEPELCVRLRKIGWEIWRLDQEMTLHDAALSRFSQWWQRNRRAGHAYAEGMALHGGPPERHNVRQTRSALIWGAALPLIALLGGLLFTPLALLLLLAWPAQVVRLARRDGDWAQAFFLTLGKLPEALGVLDFRIGRMRGVHKGLIEYK